MRITAEAKQANRLRLQEVARRLFEEKGFAATSTRQIASAAQMAAGTLFNYFAGKEALALSLLTEALDRARLSFEETRREGETLEEALFGHIASGLRELEPARAYAGEVLEAALSPFQQGGALAEGDALRQVHLETVDALLRAHGYGATPSFVTLHLYWTLYVGVLAFWSNDESPKQEDTLAVLDESVRLFVASLTSPLSSEPVDPATPK